MKAAVLLVLVAACGEPTPHRTTPLYADGGHLRDEQGRVAILRGINARVGGVFDVTFSDGRIPLEPIPDLTPADCRRMRALGLDLLRLPIHWSGVEPARGAYSDDYLAKVDAAIACAADAGMFVVVDLHQDAYSKEIGEDGAPLWAIQPPPTMLLQGPLTDLGERRLSAQVRMAFGTFFSPGDPSGLQADFSAMIGHVAARYADHPAVIGFELFNEPDTGTAELDEFHARASAAVRAAAPDKLVFFEPSALRNFTDFLPTPKEPFPLDGAVYSPHVYTFVFQSDQRAFQTATPEILEPSVRAAREEATAFGTPLWIGEFGVGPSTDPQHDLWMHTQAQLHDRYFASNAFWLWKEQSQGSWGVYDYDAGTSTWTERPQVVGWLSRVHAVRIGGTPKSLESSVLGDSLTLELEPGSAVGAPTQIYVPERYRATTRATCSGTEVALATDATTGIAEVTCAGLLVVSQR